MNVLLTRLYDWAEKASIFTKSNHSAQCVKFYEEFGELCSAILKRNYANIPGELADVWVTYNICFKFNLLPQIMFPDDDCDATFNYLDVHSILLSMVEDFKDNKDIFPHLSSIAAINDINLYRAIEAKLIVLEGRLLTGAKMVNGVVVKGADL